MSLSRIFSRIFFQPLVLAPLFHLLLSSLTHLCLPVEFLQGRDGVGRVAEHCLSQSAGKTTRGRAAGAGGAGRLSRGGPARTPTLPRARAPHPPAAAGAAVAALGTRPGGAALRAGRATRGPGLSCQPPTLLKRVDPFLPSGRTSRRICYFKTFHSIEPLKKKERKWWR